jgi:DNA-binding NarL/FixJ family response regulator
MRDGGALMNIQVQLSTASGGEPAMQVWLVDDNSMLRGLIAETLEREGGIRCSRQFDSPNGLLSTLASRTGPDVILLDVQMGELNGLDALPAIKSLARDTRVFMLTTFFNPAWHKQAMESGASGYHLKGESLERLLHSIQDRSSTGTPVRRRRPRCRATQSEPAGKPESSAASAKTIRPRTGVLGWFKRLTAR